MQGDGLEYLRLQSCDSHLQLPVHHYKVSHLAIEFTPHVHLVMSNQGTESNLCQNMMMGKSIFETSKHPAFKGSNDTFGVKFLLAGKQVREERAK